MKPVRQADMATMHASVMWPGMNLYPLVFFHLSARKKKMDIPRRILRQKAERGNGTTQIPKADMHRDAHSALQATADVIPVPRDTHRHEGVDAGRREERPCVLNSRLGGGGEHGEAENGGELKHEHEDAALFHLVCCEAGGNGEAACHCEVLVSFGRKGRRGIPT